MTSPLKKRKSVRTIIFSIAALTIIPAAFFLAAGFYIYTRDLALGRERRSVSVDADLAKTLTVNTMESQLYLAKAWASLDSTRLFLRDGYPRYGENVMRHDFFKGFAINLLAIYDLEGNKRLEHFYLHNAAKLADTDFDLANELLPAVQRVIMRSNIFRRGSPEKGYRYSTYPGLSGFQQIGGLWFYVSLVPVAPLDGSEAEKGVLVMGKVILRSELNRLIELNERTRFSLQAIEEGSQSEKYQLDLYRQGYAFDYDGDEYIKGYQVIETLSGKKLLVTALRDRSFTHETIQVFAHGSIIIFFTAVAVLTAVVFALDKVLLRKLGRLAAVVENIENPTATIELPSFRSLELTSLVNALGALLQRSAAHQEIIEEQNQTLIYAARHDRLTGLGNVDLYRIKLAEAAGAAGRRAGNFAVVALEINGFRRINETLGYTVGDEVLTNFAARLVAFFEKRAETFRTGGCEFAAILPDFASCDALTTEVRQLTSCCGQPLVAGNREIRLAVRVGIVLYPDDTTDITKLEQFLDLALNEAQQNGSSTNYKFFRPKLYEKISEQLFLENDIARGIAKDEFDVYLQPKLGVATNSIRDAEALIRWRREGGVMPPGKFMPIAESSGLIVPLTWTVLDKSCLYAKKLHDAGLADFSVAVNISAQVLHNSEFVDRVIGTLREYSLDGRFLNLELTEDTLVTDAEASCQIMYRLRKLGVQISIDDFGTGYSSLQYLHKMPFDWIKIDKTFVDGLPHKRDSLAIVDASRAIARAMGLGVVFEGVETLQQWDCIFHMQRKQIRHDQIQGYVVSKPLPFERFEEAIKRWNGPYGPRLNTFFQPDE